jgi:Rps23 Pro-64 3,4-dihydroxylase Tpa1-like proline 4-hydroxylase
LDLGTAFMTRPVPLFEINPNLDHASLARRFRADGRVQIRNVLTEETAREVRRILARQTPWGLAWRAGPDGPHFVRQEDRTKLSVDAAALISSKLTAAAQGGQYAFVYSAYPMLDAYRGRWDRGGPHDLLLEYLNEDAFLGFVREVTGIAGLCKADAQATLYAPGQFLAPHDDSHVAEGWRVAYVLSLATDDWRPEWGGYLAFYDEGGDIVAGFRPRFNALNLFAVPQRHDVTYVPPFSPLGRYAITGWLRDR